MRIPTSNFCNVVAIPGLGAIEVEVAELAKEGAPRAEGLHIPHLHCPVRCRTRLTRQQRQAFRRSPKVLGKVYLARQALEQADAELGHATPEAFAAAVACQLKNGGA
jgi:hypothetical protein